MRVVTSPGPLLRTPSACRRGLLAAALALAACASSASEPAARTEPAAAPMRRPRRVATCEVGAPCPADLACSVDHTAFLRCDGQRMVVQSLCRGDRQCTADESSIVCDQSVAEIGDACDHETAACSLDGLNMLECKDGRFTLRSACPDGCETHRRLVECHGAVTR